MSIFILFCPPVSMAGLKEAIEDLGGVKRASDYELRFLPPYCRCRVALNEDRYKNDVKKWRAIFYSKGERGKDWIHLHHYCAGLLMLSRLQRGLGKRTALLLQAENEINYVIEHSSPKFILMPEIHLKMGITQKLMGNDVKAMQHFTKAIQLKKNYVPAYAHIIDFFKEHQNYKKAIETAKRGLKYSPNSKALKAKLRELQSLSTTKQ